MPGIGLVAGAALLFGVGAGKGKGGQAVIKSAVVPTGAEMATLAGLVRIKFFGNLAAVHVVVAIDASLADSPEIPPAAVLLMAHKARRCGMGAFQGKPRFLMIRYGKATVFEPVDRMAGRTIGSGPRRRGELILVVIGMAGRARVVWKRVYHSGRMAFPAIHRLVLPRERIARQTMVEARRRSRHAKRFFPVAVGAAAAELALMDIRMAGNALIGRHPKAILENRKRRSIEVMAIAAINLLMLAL